MITTTGLKDAAREMGFTRENETLTSEKLAMLEAVAEETMDRILM